MSDRKIEPEQFQASEAEIRTPWVSATVVSLAVLAVGLGSMYLLGLFRMEHGADSEAVAAAIALIGTIASASVTLVGIVLKYSIDARSARLASVTAKQNYALALKAQRQNSTDIALRAVGLLGENNKDATEGQIRGALLALLSLGEIDLSISLLAEFWRRGIASSDVAVQILMKALSEGSETTKIGASYVLQQNAEKILQKEGHIWPIPVLRWDNDLPRNCRLGLLIAAKKWLITELDSNPSRFPTSLVVLDQAIEDPDEGLSDAAASIVKPVVQFLPPDLSKLTANGQIDCRTIQEKVIVRPVKKRTPMGADFKAEMETVIARVDNRLGGLSAGHKQTPRDVQTLAPSEAENRVKP